MRYLTRHESGRRVLAAAGIGLAVFVYGGFFLNEYNDSGTVTVFWPAAVFWIAVVAWCVRTLLSPRDYVDIDTTARLARVVRQGATVREVPLARLAPLEIFEFVPLKQSNFRVLYGIRSQPMPDVVFGDERQLSLASRRLEAVSRALGLVASTQVVPSPDLTKGGEGTWIDSDPESPADP
jgi:hypothetical protein